MKAKQNKHKQNRRKDPWKIQGLSLKMDLNPDHSKEEFSWKQLDTGVFWPTDELTHMEKVWDHGERQVMWKLGREHCPRCKSCANIFDMETKSSRAVSNKLAIHKHHSLWCFLTTPRLIKT